MLNPFLDTSHWIKKYPYKGTFNSQELARWHITDKPGSSRSCSHNSILWKDRYYTWMGNKGWIEEAPLNMKWHYMRCVEEHNNEDAAKEWAWLCGYSVSRSRSHVPALLQELAKEGRLKGLNESGGLGGKAKGALEEPQPSKPSSATGEPPANFEEEELVAALDTAKPEVSMTPSPTDLDTAQEQ